MYPVLFLTVLFAYFVSAVSFIVFSFNKNYFLSKFALFSTVFGFIMHSIALIVRTLVAGFLPMTNLYESLVLFSWAVVLLFITIEHKFKIAIIGAFTMPLAFLITSYAAVLDSSIKPLMPALRSYWLFIHVLACFLGYACFTCAFSLAIMYLLQERQVKSKHIGKIFERLPSLNVMDKINHQLVLFGFAFLTLGIVTGSVWAQQAWGRWWSWDPKETWSLITWFIYAAYLHARFNSGWPGKRMAILSIIGYISVLFTYLGVNFLLPGLHSYL